MVGGRICGLSVRDVRFPTSLGGHGSDAMHTDPDYSAAYVILETDVGDGLKGYGITFTLGRGTEVVVCAVNALAHHVLSKDLRDIVGDFRGFYRQLTSDGQLRWIGPEKGAVHLATAAVLNAVWDLWAKQEGKPLWKLLVDMKYCRKVKLVKKKELCTEALKDGWTRFKVKVGADLQDDIRRCRLIRDMIGPEKILMMDANQRWDVPEAVEWMSKLAEFKPLWIEEPTSPDDILGHATISKALVPLGIGVATGEQCHNRVIFKQLLQAKALQFLQIDSCRLGSVNENLSVLLMAKKFEIPVCPHAGGVGLCELVQHLIIFDFISVSASLKNRMCEYVDHLHEHFRYPVIIKKASYMPPKDAGYSTEMKTDSVQKHQYPDGDVWKKLLAAQGN
ncbi:PREDICTED: mitochondrial enolase superfamily member 1 isoform X2 [Ceratotherium simum simum]|uniref:Mitochondrial enolase superfamily member 1 isoform X2 n=1 Tax=Ceratotherium simum simum TaxID=73337 RepID=A0ABM1C890_CERSS|nr:PREDICTED: mitochondrial enolase superfamily member 1 isoform X2 [Ceratotherium simum simum]